MTPRYYDRSGAEEQQVEAHSLHQTCEPLDRTTLLDF